MLFVIKFKLPGGAGRDCTEFDNFVVSCHIWSSQGSIFFRTNDKGIIRDRRLGILSRKSWKKCGKSISFLTELKLPYVSLFQLFLAQTTFFFRYFGKIFILTRDIWWSRFGTKWVKVFVQNEVSSWRQYPGAAKMKPVAYFLLSSFINHSAEKKSLLREPLGPQ